MKIAHFSDLHLLALDGVSPIRFANKRLSGWVNLKVKRSSIHHTEYVRAIAREVARIGVDHVVVTGDLTNLALESEFELARDLLRGDLGLDPSKVSIVPGNHDLYTRGSLVARRFEEYLGEWLTSDLPALAVEANGARFPVVKLCGSVAIVALSSAVPRPPFVAAGEIGGAQLEALQRVLAHPEVARRTTVLALHHPAVARYSRAKTYLEGLRDAPALLGHLQRLPQGLILHGHLHRRIQREVTTDAGRLQQFGATSASLQHEARDRMAGFNLYEVDDSGLRRASAHVYAPETGTFHIEFVPKHV